MRVTEPAQVGRVVGAATRSRDDVIHVGAWSRASAFITAYRIADEDHLAKLSPGRTVATLSSIASLPVVCALTVRTAATTMGDRRASRRSKGGSDTVRHNCYPLALQRPQTSSIRALLIGMPQRTQRGGSLKVGGGSDEGLPFVAACRVEGCGGLFWLFPIEPGPREESENGGSLRMEPSISGSLGAALVPTLRPMPM